MIYVDTFGARYQKMTRFAVIKYWSSEMPSAIIRHWFFSNISPPSQICFNNRFQVFMDKSITSLYGQFKLQFIHSSYMTLKYSLWTQSVGQTASGYRLLHQDPWCIQGDNTWISLHTIDVSHFSRIYSIPFYHANVMVCNINTSPKPANISIQNLPQYRANLHLVLWAPTVCQWLFCFH